ncbi:MAG: hypothetical protein EAX96_21370 [Candidatus Lokiarchaeota archaeon]|nr:hypothetical protein [Candidatus Lokiarchaeota archaeon]
MEDLTKKVEKLISISDNIKDLGKSIVDDVEKIGLKAVLENFEQFNAFVPKVRDTLQELLPQLTRTLDIVEKTGYNTIFDNMKNLNEYVSMGQDLNAEILPLIPRLWNVQRNALDAISEDEDIKDELEDTEDVNIAILIEDMDQAVTVQIVDHKLNFKLGAVPEPDLTVNIPMAALGKLSSGDLSDMMSAYMAGDVKVQGDLTKAMSLRGVIEFLSDKIGLGA